MNNENLILNQNNQNSNDKWEAMGVTFYAGTNDFIKNINKINQDKQQNNQNSNDKWEAMGVTFYAGSPNY